MATKQRLPKHPGQKPVIPDGRYPTEFHKAIGEDLYVSMILEYVHGRLDGPLLRKIRALQRAAQIASACEDYAVNGKSAPL